MRVARCRWSNEISIKCCTDDGPRDQRPRWRDANEVNWMFSNRRRCNMIVIKRWKKICSGTWRDAVDGRRHGTKPVRPKQQKKIWKNKEFEWQINRDSFSTADGIPGYCWRSRTTHVFVYCVREASVVAVQLTSCTQHIAVRWTRFFSLSLILSLSRCQHIAWKLRASPTPHTFAIHPTKWKTTEREK